MNIRERVLEELFDKAVEEKGVCEDMDRAYSELYQFCDENAPADQVDNYLDLSTEMQREAFLAGARMALDFVSGR